MTRTARREHGCWTSSLADLVPPTATAQGVPGLAGGLGRGVPGQRAGDPSPGELGRIRVRKLWHAARRAGLEVGRDQVGRLMSIAGIRGAVRGRHRTITTRRDDTRHGTLTWSSAAGTPRPVRTSCGWPTSPTCGRWPGSATSRSSSTCSPAGFWAGGCPPRSTRRWSPTPSGRSYTFVAATNRLGPQ